MEPERRRFNEVKRIVLRSLISASSLTAREIADETQENINSVYNVLNRLRKSSLVGRSKELRGVGRKQRVWVYTTNMTDSMHDRALAKLEWYERLE